MSASLIKKAAVKAIAAKMATVTGLSAVTPLQPGNSTDATYPSVSVVARAFRYRQAQRSERSRVGGNQVYNVGRFEGSVQIRVNGRTPDERGLPESKIEHEFLRQDTPGTLECQTADVSIAGVNIGAAKLWLEFRNAEWRDEPVNAAERRRYSFIEVGCIYPALIVEEVPLLTDLHLLFTRDLTTEVGEEGDVTGIEHHDYLITADGPELQ